MDLYPLRVAAVNLISAIDTDKLVPSDQGHVARAAAHMKATIEQTAEAHVEAEVKAAIEEDGLQFGPFKLTSHGLVVDLAFLRDEEDKTDNAETAEPDGGTPESQEPVAIGLGDRFDRALYVGDKVQVTGSSRYGEVLGVVTGATGEGRVKMDLDLSTSSMLADEHRGEAAPEAYILPGYTSSPGRVERVASVFQSSGTNGTAAFAGS